MAPGETSRRPRLAWITDFDFPARGRDYGAEDRWLISRLGDEFDIRTLDPRDASSALTSDVDLVVVRNSGPVAGYAREYAEFRERARGAVPVYNELTGRADMLGKHYLLDMYRSGMDVIPTATAEAVGSLPPADTYVVKPVHGADSAGLRFVGPEELGSIDDPDVLVQPRVEMQAELSFVFVDDSFQYAVSTTPDGERWQVVEYDATDADLEFARAFIDWNDIRHGIQRVDACRTADGRLLLVELEDLNPYLSLDVLSEATRERFVATFGDALRRALDGQQRTR